MGNGLFEDVSKRFIVPVTQGEFETAKSFANQKLKFIINNFGDCDGDRLTPEYMAYLIADYVQIGRLAKYQDKTEALDYAKTESIQWEKAAC